MGLGEIGAQLQRPAETGNGPVQQAQPGQGIAQIDMIEGVVAANGDGLFHQGGGNFKPFRLMSDHAQ